MSPVFRHGRLRLYLLKLLDEAPRHGYEVIRLLQDRFLGVYAPSPGTIYPRLARLEEEGLVTHDEVDGRKIYRITDAGREEIRTRLDDLAELEEEITESVRDIAREVTQDVRDTVRNLREELAWAARDVRRESREQQRDEARQDAAQQRHEAGHAEPDAGPAGPDAGRAGPAEPDARRAGPAEPDAGRAGPAEPEAGPAGPDTGRADQAGPEAGQPHGDQDRDARRGTRRGGKAGRGGRREWADWAGSRDWQAWAGWQQGGWPRWPGSGEAPGGPEAWARATSDRPDAGLFRDLERMAIDFARELRTAARHTESVGENALGDLRAILEDTLTRIRDEVFGAAAPDDQDNHADDGDA